MELQASVADLTSAKASLTQENSSLSAQLEDAEGRAATLGKNKKSLEQQLEEIKNSLEEESRVCIYHIKTKK